MRVAIVQRVCAPYRVAVFRSLARRQGIDQLLLYGRGTPTGQWQNAQCLDGLESIRLFTLSKQFRLGKREYYVALHPSLPWHLRRFRPDVILAEGITNMPNNILLAQYCRLTKTPLVLWDAGRNPSLEMGRLRTMAEPIQRRMLQRASACVGYGKSSIQYFLRVGVDPKRAFLAQNCVDFGPIQDDLESWSSRESEVLATRVALGLEHRKVVLHIGSLHPSKPLDSLIRACGYVQRSGLPVGLLVIGDGPDSDRLRALSLSEGLEAAHFLGRVTDNLARYALLSDVAAFPSTATLGIMTALAYGVPVLAARGRAPEWEAIRDGQNGILMKPEDEAGLTTLLTSIVRGDLGFSPPRAIREGLRKEFGLEKMVDGLFQALEYAVKRGGRDERAAHVTREPREAPLENR